MDKLDTFELLTTQNKLYTWDYRVRSPKSRKSAFCADMSFTPLLPPLREVLTSFNVDIFA